ncbi:MAG: T9SS type A sorting domain-containing protein, partial [Bacteroidota bacterium]
TSTAGTYTVTVTQSNGCTSTASVTVTADQSTPTVSASSSNVITCNQPSTTVSATAAASSGNTISTYLWSPGGQTTASFTTSTAGTYTVTVTQSNGCTSSASTTVISNVCTPTVSASNNGPITCTTTSVTLSASATACTGTSIVSYLWSNGATTATTTTSTAGTYTVTVTQSNGCTSTASTILSVDTCRPTVTASNNGPITCTFPSRTVSAVGTPCTGRTLTYLWSSGQTTTSFSTTVSGTYTVTVTQSVNGCTASASTTLTRNDSPPVVSCSASNAITCGNPTAILSVTATPTAGNTITGYLWSPGGATTSSIVVSNSTVYTVIVTQSNGCTATTSCSALTIVSPTVLTVTATSTPASGLTTANGSVTATASGGTPPYSYLWSNGATTATVFNLLPGTYTVTVTDQLGCTATATTTVGVSACSGFVSYTQAQWGASNSSLPPYQLLNSRFNTYFTKPRYLTIGCTNKLTFTKSLEVDRFLPSTGPIAPLPAGTLTNPGTSYSNALAGEAVALTLNVVFDSANVTFAPATTLFKDLIVASGPFAGLTVRQVLNIANNYLGGCGSTYTATVIYNALVAINRNFESGTVDRGYLICPVPSVRMAPANGNPHQVVLYPNPTTGDFSIDFSAESVGRVTMQVIDISGRICSQLEIPVTETGIQTVSYSLKEQRFIQGIYFIRLITNDYTKDIRVVLTN